MDAEYIIENMVRDFMKTEGVRDAVERGDLTVFHVAHKLYPTIPPDVWRAYGEQSAEPALLSLIEGLMIDAGWIRYPRRDE